MIVDRINYHEKGYLKAVVIAVKATVKFFEFIIDRKDYKDNHSIFTEDKGPILKFSGNANTCSSCRQCEEFCPTKCLELKSDQGFFFDEFHCLQCNLCVLVCPTSSLSLNSGMGVRLQHTVYNLFEDDKKL